MSDLTVSKIDEIFKDLKKNWCSKINCKINGIDIISINDKLEVIITNNFLEKEDKNEGRNREIKAKNEHTLRILKRYISNKITVDRNIKNSISLIISTLLSFASLFVAIVSLWADISSTSDNVFVDIVFMYSGCVFFICVIYFLRLLWRHGIKNYPRELSFYEILDRILDEHLQEISVSKTYEFSVSPQSVNKVPTENGYNLEVGISVNQKNDPPPNKFGKSPKKP